MAAIEEMIQALLQSQQGIQRTAQNNLPVTPNNGNPGGANNMPTIMPSPQPRQDPYPWARSGPMMDWIRQFLQNRGRTVPPTQALPPQMAQTPPAVPSSPAQPLPAPGVVLPAKPDSMQGFPLIQARLPRSTRMY